MTTSTNIQLHVVLTLFSLLFAIACAVVGAEDDDSDEDPEEESAAKLRTQGDRLVPCIKAQKDAGRHLFFAEWYRIVVQDGRQRNFLHERAVSWVPEGADAPPPLISRLIHEAQAQAAAAQKRWK